MANDTANCTLFVGNVPYDATNDEFDKVFSSFGPLRRCFIVKNKGVGYATFSLREDAEKALQNVKSMGGRKLNLKFANKKCDRPLNGKQPETLKCNVKDKKKRKSSNRKVAEKKSSSQNKRLIIRNLSFKATEDTVRKVFEKCGNIVQVVIPHKSDGKKIGVCFVEFENEDEAKKAINTLNFIKILDRPVAVDWAVPKDEYVEIVKSNSQVEDAVSKNRTESDDSMDRNHEIAPNKKNVLALKSISSNEKASRRSIVANVEDDDLREMVDSSSSSSSDEDESVNGDVESEESSVHSSNGISSQNDDGDSVDETMDNETHKLSEDEEEEDEEDEEDEEEDEEDEEEDENEDEEEDEKPKKAKGKPFKDNHSSDVLEGRTLFVRNINFDTSKEKLEEVFSQFGALQYALICMDPLTEHSKGSGFVKFLKKEDADKCLSQAEEGGINLDGNQLLVNAALPKDVLQKQITEKKEKAAKDNRNLYLAREGLIRPGTLAAEGVSKRDMAIRMELELRKRQMIKNLHVFISKTRLCVRNLPFHLHDTKLRSIFLKAGGPGASITEARIMRDFSKFGADNQAESKGYGFVNFTSHEHALRALRSSNNNPKIFNPKKRPIVEFSLENKAALRARQKRFEKSLQNNKKNSGQFEQTMPITKPEFHQMSVDEEFVGTKADSHSNAKCLPSHLGPKIRLKKRNNPKISRRNLQKEKMKHRKQKRKLKLEAKSTSNDMLPRKRMKKNADDSNIDKLVSNYQQRKRESGEKTKVKKKWFT